MMNRRDFIATSAAACLLPLVPKVEDSRPVRVFAFCDGEEHVAARSREEAAAFYEDLTGEVEDNFREVTDEEMARKIVNVESDYEPGHWRATFAEALAADVSRGIATPYYFASSNC